MRRLSAIALLGTAQAMTSKATPSLTSKATPSLPSLHAALSAPLGRKYSRVQSWRPGGSATAGPTRVELSFSEPDMVDSKPSAHAVYYDLVTDGSGLSLAATPVQVPLGAELKLSHRAPAALFNNPRGGRRAEPATARESP